MSDHGLFYPIAYVWFVQWTCACPWVAHVSVCYCLAVGYIALCVFMLVSSFAFELPCLNWAGGSAVLWWNRIRTHRSTSTHYCSTATLLQHCQSLQCAATLTALHLQTPLQTPLQWLLQAHTARTTARTIALHNLLWWGGVGCQNLLHPSGMHLGPAGSMTSFMSSFLNVSW